MTRWLVLILLGLAYTALVVGGLAWLLQRRMGPRRAVWTAFALSLLAHGAGILLLTEPERWLPLLLWLIPHLLVVPPLLFVAAVRAGR